MTCDWWTLGVLIYEFLSGSPPFYDESQYKVYEKILTAKIEWPRYFDSTAKDIIKKLLNNDPTKRLGSGNCGTGHKSSKPKTETPSKMSIESSESIITESTLNKQSSLSSSIFLTQTVEQILEKEKEIENNKRDNKSDNSPVKEKSSDKLLTNITGATVNTERPSISSHAPAQSVNQVQKSKNITGSEEVKNHRWFSSILNWTDVYERRLKPPFKPEVSHEGDTRNFEKYDTPDLSKAPVASETQVAIFSNF